MKELPAQGLSIFLLEDNDEGQKMMLAGGRLAELHITNAPVELSRCNPHGWREYIPEAGSRSLSLLVKGLALRTRAEQKLQQLALSGAEQSCRLELEGGMCLQGPFVVRSFGFLDHHGDELTFDLGLESSGQISIDP